MNNLDYVIQNRNGGSTQGYYSQHFLTGGFENLGVINSTFNYGLGVYIFRPFILGMAQGYQIVLPRNNFVYDIHWIHKQQRVQLAIMGLSSIIPPSVHVQGSTNSTWYGLGVYMANLRGMAWVWCKKKISNPPVKKCWK